MDDIQTFFYLDYLIYKICKELKEKKEYTKKINSLLKIFNTINNEIKKTKLDIEFEEKIIISDLYQNLIKNLNLKSKFKSKFELRKTIEDFYFKSKNYSNLKNIIQKMLCIYFFTFENEYEFNKKSNLIFFKYSFNLVKRCFFKKYFYLNDFYKNYLDFIFFEVDNYIDKLKIPFLFVVVGNKCNQIYKSKKSIISGVNNNGEILDFDSE